MALIKCPECGKEISDQSKVCIHCGYPLDTNQVSEANGTSSDVEKNNNLQNKKIALAAIGGLILVGIVVIVLVNANNPLKRAQKYYKEGNLEAFTENKIEMSSEEANTFTQQLIGDVDRVNEDYVSGKISYEEAVEQLEKILSYGDTSSISNYNTVKYDIDYLKKSRDAFDDAQVKEAEGDYISAYNAYSKVITNDSNYQTAQDKLTEIKTKVYDAYISEAAGYANEEDYSKAVSTLGKAKDFTDDSFEVDKLEAEYNKRNEEKKEAERLAARAEALKKDGDVIDTKNAQITIVSCEITDHVYPDKRTGYYTYYSVKDTGTTWVDMKLNVKNTGAGILNLYTMVEDAVAIYDGSYEYSTKGLYYSVGNDIDKLYEYFSNSIDPLKEVTLHIVIELPVEVKTSGKSVDVEAVLDGTKLIYEVQ